MFSAPNYLGHARNKGAVVKLTLNEEGHLTPSFITYEPQVTNAVALGRNHAECKHEVCPNTGMQFIIREKNACILANYSSKPRCLLTGFWFLLSQILDFVPGLEVAFSDKQVYMLRLRRLTMTIPATVRGKTTAHYTRAVVKGFQGIALPAVIHALRYCRFLQMLLVPELEFDIGQHYIRDLILIVAEAEGLGWSAFHESLVANRSTKMVCT